MNKSNIFSALDNLLESINNKNPYTEFTTDTFYENSLYDLPSNWMEMYLPYFHHKRLIDMIIPGSHHSASYRITGKTVTPEIACGISVCQKISIYKQLRMGIRMLDIRFKFYNEDNFEAFCCHGIHRSDLGLKNALMEVNSYLINNPKEFIMIKFTCDGGNDEQKAYCCDLVLEVFKNKLIN